jgi:hypothetical protein
MFRTLLWLAVFLPTSFLMAQDVETSLEMSDKDAVEYLWQKHLEEELDPVVFYAKLNEVKITSVSVSDQLRLKVIESYFSNRKLESTTDLREEISEEEALKLVSDWDYIQSSINSISLTNKNKLTNAKNYLHKINHFTAKTPEEMKDLFYNAPDYAHYNNGEYKDGLKLFLFCRHDRRYPCRLVMRDIFDNAVLDADLNLWSMPLLAHSRRELPYNVTNGYTPSGVHTIDSVMPAADQQVSFGKWRRLILNWVPKTKNELNTKAFLPKTAHNKMWWHEASVARDVGRKWLRIHGTGNRNTDPKTTFYPHYPTAGCISTRELRYDGINYNDQRVLLDKMMEAMQMAPVFVNEVNLKGVLYVIELDDEKAPVTSETLKTYGID